MPDLTVWKNKQIQKMKRDMDRLFTDFFREFGIPSFAEDFGEMPSVEVTETEDSVIVTAELPGLDPEDYDISVSEHYLLLKGKKKEHLVRQGTNVERTGTFTNRLRLPCKIEPDRVEACYKDNRLRITMPKCKKPGFQKIKITRDEK